MKHDFKPGDAVKVPKKDGGYYEAYVSQNRGEAYSRAEGTIVVHMNWDGDGVYVDQRPEDLVPMPIHELSTVMRREAMKLRQAYYRKHDGEEGKANET